jgi:hypothetical protein
VFAYARLGPDNVANSNRERIKPGMSLTETMKNKAGWSFCNVYQENGREHVNRISLSRGGNIIIDADVIKNADSPAMIPLILEAQMKKLRGTWKMDFGYLTAAGPHAYLTVDKDLHVCGV